MITRLVRNSPYVALAALALALLVGTIAMSSVVQVVAVGVSWLGLGSPVGLAVSVAVGLVTIVAVNAIACALVFVALERPQEGCDGGPGGGGPSGPEGPCLDPAWWPQFEREFAAHVRARAGGPAGSSRAPVGAPSP